MEETVNIVEDVFLVNLRSIGLFGTRLNEVADCFSPDIFV